MDASLGIIFGLVSMLGFGLGAGIVKVPIKRIGVLKTLFLRNVFISCIFFLVFLPLLYETFFSPVYLSIAVAISVIGYIPVIAYYKAIRVGKVGVVTPIANSSLVFTVIFSIIFFGEILTPGHLASIILIIAGVVLVSLDFSGLKNSDLFRLSSGIPFALVTSLLWGLVFFLLKIPATVIGPVMTAFILEFGIMILSGANLKLSGIGYAMPDRKTLLLIFLTAVGGAAGTLFFNMGITVADVSIVSALTFSSPLIVTLYGRVFYRERLTALRYVAVALMIAGIVLISYF